MGDNVIDFDRFVEDNLSEGLITTYPIQKTVSYIQTKLNVGDESIDVVYPGKKDEYIIVDKSLDDDVLNKIDKMLDSCGYVQTYEEDDAKIYDKKFVEDIFDKMKSIGINYLYHITPSVNDNKISTQGLVPKNKSKKYTYPTRIYLLPDTEVKENRIFFKSFCTHLYTMGDNISDDGMRKIVSYSVYKIDFSKLTNIKIYEATNTKNYKGYYTTDCIRPEWMEKIFEIKIY